MRIALLEDDPDQAGLLKRWLGQAGHALTSYDKGKAFVKHIARESYDLYLLDWDIPDMSGEEVLEWIRKRMSSRIPVMFITVHAEESYIVAALDKGADDYLTKPVGKLELLARVGALERRTKREFSDTEVLKFDPYVIDVKARKISLAGKDIELTTREFELALFLFRHADQLLSRGHVLETVWGRNPDINTRTVDTHMSRIRRKLDLGPATGWRLTSVYFYGYRLERPAAPPA
jgi:two-component system, OmpR family, response regulator RegX3